MLQDGKAKVRGNGRKGRDRAVVRELAHASTRGQQWNEKWGALWKY